MLITERWLRRIIRGELLSESQRRDHVSTFLRFGDPRQVKGGRSVIHDPYAYAYSEEPALGSFEPGESPPRLQSEVGVSAYPVVSDEPGRIVFRIGNGMGTFSRQLGGFLMKRLMNEDVWIFSASRIPGALGADDEPLVDAKTIRSPQRIRTEDVWVTMLDSGDPQRDAARAERMLDLLDPWELMSYHDMSYDEFFKRRTVSREEIETYIADLRSRFRVPDQVRRIDEVEQSWLAGWDEDHGRP
jgi:hypothetical protein